MEISKLKGRSIQAAGFKPPSNLLQTSEPLRLDPYHPWGLNTLSHRVHQLHDTGTGCYTTGAPKRWRKVIPRRGQPSARIGFTGGTVYFPSPNSFNILSIFYLLLQVFYPVIM